MENCGYCKQCIRLRKLKSMKVDPCEPVECVYKHILQVYKDSNDAKEGSSCKEEKLASSIGSCGGDCRWLSQSNSSARSTSNDDSYGSIFYYEHITRKRVVFSKRRHKS